MSPKLDSFYQNSHILSSIIRNELKLVQIFSRLKGIQHCRRNFFQILSITISFQACKLMDRWKTLLEIFNLMNIMPFLAPYHDHKPQNHHKPYPNLIIHALGTRLHQYQALRFKRLPQEHKHKLKNLILKPCLGFSSSISPSSIFFLFFFIFFWNFLLLELEVAEICLIYGQK